ncbi:MAG: PAS domain S-box protein [Gemmataceae bacterium]|nr:PAS domain S-box protein [Gemmataceae bacterium]
MSLRARTLVVRVAAAAGLAAAGCAGALLHWAFAGPVVYFLFSAVLLLAVVLAVAAAGRQRAEAAGLRSAVRAAAARERAAVQDTRLREDRLRLLESAVVHAHDGVVVLEAEPGDGGAGRRVLYANAAFCRMTGYAFEEIVGRSLHPLRGPDSDPETLARLRDALDAGRPLQCELRNRRKDGTGYWVELSLVPVPDYAGRVVHWVMIQRDVTDRKRVEQEFRRSEEMFRGMFEGTSAGVTLTDPAGRFASCNPAFAAMVGRTVEEVLALTPVDVTHPDDWAAQAPYMAEVRAGTRDRFNFMKRYLRPGGEEVWAELSFAAIRGPDGRLEYGLGVSLNVTERRRLEEQLRQAHKLEAIGQMAGGIAHDFNNLLTLVLGNLALVRLADDDPNRPLLGSVEQAARRAADLTRMLVGYARRNQIMPGPVGAARAFDEVVSLLRRTVDPRVRIVTRVPADCPPLLADPTLLNQALVNLCLNARDAMPEGGTLVLTADPVAVTAADHPDAVPGEYVRLGVADTGTGMTDEVRARVFEPFFTTKGPGKGTGLGLPMVQGIVKQHRGWVEFTTAPGAGTRIDLFFPVAPVSAVPVPVPTPPPPNTTGAAAAGHTILLVDDEPMIRQLGRVVLERAGYTVLTAEDGRDAVEVFARERGRISLVVLDSTMPRMCGRDAFRKMIELDPHARVLFSTGYSADDLSDLEGSLGLLAKPYRPEGLLAAVRDALATTTPAAD